MPKDSFNAPDCCVDCKVDTPEKFFGCEYPCDNYKREVADKAANQVSQAARLSAESIKRKPRIGFGDVDTTHRSC